MLKSGSGAALFTQLFYARPYLAKTWHQKKQVTARMQPVGDGSHLLWEYVSSLIDDAVQKGFLAE